MVVSGWYKSRSGNNQVMVFEATKHGWRSLLEEELTQNIVEQRLKQVDAVGAGCLLIKREVFNTLQTNEPFMEKTGIKHGKQWTGEDLYFSQLLNQHKIPLHIDITAQCGHYGWNIH